MWKIQQHFERIFLLGEMHFNENYFEFGLFDFKGHGMG